MNKFLLFLFAFLLYAFSSVSQKIERIEPPNWWTGMENNTLQLLVYGKDIGQAEVKINSDLVNLLVIHKVPNKNYLFVDLEILPGAKAGKFTIDFYKDEKLIGQYDYMLREKKKRQRGFSPDDFIYLLMPDRFANGDPSNDSMDKMKEKSDRNNPDGRHGGDIQGVIDNLDYIQNLGITSVWLNPTLENDRKSYSYHGYGITDFYKTDVRMGTNDLYKQLAQELHARDMKIIADMIFNHSCYEHWWVKDLPTDDWLNTNKDFRTNYRGSTIMDPNASDIDRKHMVEGWFVETMPDLNQNNPFLGRYLIQNSIWWVEFAKLDGIRMDTHPYPYKEFMAQWAEELRIEYPTLTLLGETWLHSTPFTAYFQGDSPVSGSYNSHLHSVTDFPLYYSISESFNEKEGWGEGMNKLYLTLAKDFLYANPSMVVIFPDNHDLNRIFSSFDEDIDKLKMAMAFVLTTRGIPMMYYGTEILMTGFEHEGHGHIREDFPGGWKTDSRNAFTKEGRTDAENEMHDYIKTIADWRKANPDLMRGKLTHFLPDNGVYVYFRHTDDDAVMVALNNLPDQDREIDLERFNEILNGYTGGTNVLTSEKITLGKSVSIPKKSALILDLE